MIGRPVYFRLDAVALAAIDFGEFVRMRQLRDIFVAGSAKIVRVHGRGELIRMKTVMADKTVLVFDVLGGQSL
jgi:hypothetical protein